MCLFYHIKNLQSTKTEEFQNKYGKGFITLRIYKVLKLGSKLRQFTLVLSH